jgi:hypothetical protein
VWFSRRCAVTMASRFLPTTTTFGLHDDSATVLEQFSRSTSALAAGARLALAPARMYSERDCQALSVTRVGSPVLSRAADQLYSDHIIGAGQTGMMPPG